MAWLFVLALIAGRWPWPAKNLQAAQVVLVEQKHDPYGSPRPGRDHEHVPLRTSFYVVLGVEGAEKSGERVRADSVAMWLQPAGGPEISVIEPGGRFASGFSGRMFPGRVRRAGGVLIVYVEPEQPLAPSTRYRVRIVAESDKGGRLPPEQGTWEFTTEAAAKVERVSFDLDVASPPVRWHGGFFTGFCKPSFCTSRPHRVESDQLMDRVRRWAPAAWSLERSAWLTGTDTTPALLPRNLPGVVRELQTRRIVKMERCGDQQDGRPTVRLHVEDFFGHRQYGIPPGRPLSDDYQPGDEVLVADHRNSVRSKVLAVDDRQRVVTVADFADPPEGWQLDYLAPLPAEEDPHAPGLFPLGGCYLRKFSPPGTPRYFWRRLDYEWDYQHRQLGRRLIVNFVDAPIDLSVDGRPWTVPKDYVEFHQVVYAITSHVIQRYGESATQFYWSIFNEPDLRPVFWRSDWTELQKFYDYAVDAILRAFEDHGYDSNQVKVGGLELGAIFGTHLKLREFLAHCSPGAQAKGALEENAAFADERLAGKRSQRVERLCRANGGRGSPCDFISIHAYNRSDMMAAKLIRAKQMALEIDAEYFRRLWINSHESCPDWAPPPDPAAADSYRGNGYFPTWCADVARRLLHQAAADPRYSFGETILTFWPGPNRNFQGLNAATRIIHVDEDGDGDSDRTVVVAMPILHFLGLLNAMGRQFWVLPERTVGGHVASGFVGRTGEQLRLLLYTHNPLDTQSRSQKTFHVSVRLAGAGFQKVHIRQYSFDQSHNSYFELACSLAEQAEKRPPAPASESRLYEAMEQLSSGNRTAQLKALEMLARVGRAAVAARDALVELIQTTQDAQLRRRATAVLMQLHMPAAYPPEVVRRVEELSQLSVTDSWDERADDTGTITIRTTVAANGANYLVLEPQ